MARGSRAMPLSGTFSRRPDSDRYQYARGNPHRSRIPAAANTGTGHEAAVPKLRARVDGFAGVGIQAKLVPGRTESLRERYRHGRRPEKRLQGARDKPFIDLAGAAERNRTSDPVLTKDVLYRLSYGSAGPVAGALVRRRIVAITGAAEASRYLAMTTEKASGREPALSERGRRAREERQARLARALRENLRKRKAQQRARRGASEQDR